MIAMHFSALAVAAVLGVGAAAQAQAPAPQPRPGGMAASTWASGHHVPHEAVEAGRVKALHDALNIRTDQETAFQAFTASMRPEQKGPGSDDTGPGPRDMAGLTTPERLDAMGRMMDEHITRMRERFQRHATALKALYAVLGPEQRRTLDALPDLMGHGMGMAPDHPMGPGSHGGLMEHPGRGVDAPVRPE